MVSYYFSTPMVNSECPYGLPNPCVLIAEMHFWDISQTLEASCHLERQMRKLGFGELEPNLYQADSPELQTCEDVKLLLESRGMTHNDGLDSTLQECFAECT